MFRKTLIAAACLAAAACGPKNPAPGASQGTGHLAVCHAIRSAWNQLTQNLEQNPDVIQASGGVQSFADAVGSHLNQEPALVNLRNAALTLSTLEVSGTKQQISVADSALRAQYQQYANGC